MTKALGPLALFTIGCASATLAGPQKTDALTGLDLKPQPATILEVEPEPSTPKPQSEPKFNFKIPDPADIPNPRLVAALAVFQRDELLQCTEIYGFSRLPFGPPEAEIGDGIRLVPIGGSCRTKFGNQFVPAMCGSVVAEEVRKKSNMIWEQNYYFESLREDLGELEANYRKEGGSWWDEIRGGQFPDFLSVYPTPPYTEKF
jgi:hypothetical protein